jgi:hypothetical protein
MSERPCARCSRRATWPNGEWGYSTRCHMLGPERPEAVLPDRALYLLTFNKLLSLSLSLSLSFSFSLSLSLRVSISPTQLITAIRPATIPSVSA